jgi:hypothetical protein
VEAMMRKTKKAKARKHSAIKDLSPKNAKQVKGGAPQIGEMQIQKVTDKS